MTATSSELIKQINQALAALNSELDRIAASRREFLIIAVRLRGGSVALVPCEFVDTLSARGCEVLCAAMFVNFEAARQRMSGAVH